jgi:hypothetical protein
MAIPGLEVIGIEIATLACGLLAMPGFCLW